MGAAIIFADCRIVYEATNNPCGLIYWTWQPFTLAPCLREQHFISCLSLCLNSLMTQLIFLPLIISKLTMHYLACKGESLDMQNWLQKTPSKISQNGLRYFSEKNSLKLNELGSDKTMILQNVGTNFRSTNKLLIKVQDHTSPKVLIFFLSKKSYVKDLRRQKQCADKAFLCLSINLLQGFSTFLSF